jgi:hypothetical protein
MTNEIKKKFYSKLKCHPIDNILNYMKDTIPLQIIYNLDQIYLFERYLSDL